MAGSPKEVLKTSFRTEIISNDVWMEMLKVRNQLSHDYDGDIVKQMCQKIITEYIDEFYELRKKIEQLQLEE